MTRHETFPTHAISEKELVLATDLDGTFLGGSDADRRQFYGWLEANRSRVGLIFVTGRDPGFIRELTRKGAVPRPDYVVGDVGTTIAAMDGDMLSPIEALEAEIAEAWGDAGGRVQATLHRVRGLRLQSTGFRYRVSYDMDPERFDEREALDIVAGLGLDALISDNRFLDVLPKGVSKGPSLLRLLAHLGIDNRRTLVAGDTLNDLSMLTLGLPSVAVGGSEPALVEQVTGLDHVHVAQGIGVAGIAEAIVTRGMFTLS